MKAAGAEAKEPASWKMKNSTATTRSGILLVSKAERKNGDVNSGANL
jgi:hypothetical protein